jgi:hypothetical protein
MAQNGYTIPQFRRVSDALYNQYQKDRSLTQSQRSALAIMQAYLIQKDLKTQAEQYLAKLRTQLLDFMNLFAETTFEDITNFDKTVMRYLVNEDKETEELQIAPAFGQEGYAAQQQASTDKAPKSITSVREVANMIADNMKKFLRSTSVVVTQGGDRILRLASSQQG